jgi:hypothetical protein
VLGGPYTAIIFANRYGKYSGAIEKAISRMAEEKKVPGNDDSDNK